MNRRTRNAPTANSLSAETLEFIRDITGRSEPVNSLAKPESRANREQLEWLAGISPKHELELRQLLREEQQAAERYDLERWVADITSVHEAEWDPAKHPRRGSPPNAGWFATAGSTSSGTSEQRPEIEPGGESDKPPKFGGALAQRNRLIRELIPAATPQTLRAKRLAVDLQTGLELPGEVTRAFGAGLGTGGKAVVNGSATAIKNVATLGLSDHQLELIGVTQADRDRGYDTAVSIATASGGVLIAVGTGGVASVLSKGGTVARTASGTLVALDAAGSAVGDVRGDYDASTNGMNLANGTQIAAIALGVAVNAKAGRDIRPAAPEAISHSVAPPHVQEYIAKLPRKTTPTTKPANRYEIEHAGPYNYTVAGGNAEFDIDGFRDTTILEVKHVGKSVKSPFVPGSTCHEPVRNNVLFEVRSELARFRTIISSRETPFQKIQIITNSTEAKMLFERLLKESKVPGDVIYQP